MITSPDNDKLKLIRKLAQRKHREREGLFVAEGEDLVESARDAGADAVFVLRSGEDVEPALLDGVSSLGSGTRVIGVYRERWAERVDAPATYLHGIGDPGNVGTVVRTVHALVGGTVVLGPGCADPYSAKAVRASMGSVFAQPLARGGVSDTPSPRTALVAHGGAAGGGEAEVATVCLGAEREGLPEDVLAACERRWTIPVRAGAESLNVGAAAAIALGWISSAAREGGPTDA
jgi:TrmH family RNA methyltransferase